MRTRIGLAAVAIGWIGFAQIAGSQSFHDKGKHLQRSQIVFVCEHGAALSVVSAAYFNKLAREQHLNLHAIARGTSPQRDIAVSTRDGLKSDGIAFETKRPQALTRADTARAQVVVTFTPIPERFSKMAPVETWDDVPPTGTNYGVARDAILKHMNELLKKLKANAEMR